MLGTLWRALRTIKAGDLSRLTALEAQVAALLERERTMVAQLDMFRADETRRAAEHATMVDQLDRLYKRVAARIARESRDAPHQAPANGETDLDFKRRLRG